MFWKRIFVLQYLKFNIILYANRTSKTGKGNRFSFATRGGKNRQLSYGFLAPFIHIRQKAVYLNTFYAFR